MLCFESVRLQQHEKMLDIWHSIFLDSVFFTDK